MELNVNIDALVVLTNKLEKLHKSAFPVAVRTTLNSAAFDMKTTTIISSAAHNFIQRKPTFFKASSRVNQASGFNINNMKAEVGFHGKDQAIDDLQQQEKGGTIDSRSFVPLNTARTGKSAEKQVRANARLSRIKIVDSRDAKGKNDKEKFIKSVIHAGVGGHVLGYFNGKSVLWRVNSLNKTDTKQLKLTPLYSFKKGRKVKVESTKFVEEAAEVTIQKMEKMYAAAAERQFQKALK